MTLKVGDAITFKNEDIVTHNVYSSNFDLKAQKVGDSKRTVFDTPGDYVIKCAIHPKMTFMVKVTN